MMNSPGRREFVRTTLTGGAGLMAASSLAIMRDDWQAVRWTKAAIDKVVFGRG